MCQMTEDELKKFFTFEFNKIYEAYSKTQYKVNNHYIGYFDKNNNELNINYINLNGETKALITQKEIETIEFKSNGVFKIKDIF